MGSGVGVGISGGSVAVFVGRGSVGLWVGVLGGDTVFSTSPGTKTASSGGLIAYFIRARKLSIRGDSCDLTGGIWYSRNVSNMHAGVTSRMVRHARLGIMGDYIIP